MRKIRYAKYAVCSMAIVAMLAFAGCGNDEDLTTNIKDAPTPTDVTVESSENTSKQENATDESGEELKKDESGYYITNDYVKTIEQTVNVRTDASTDSSIYQLVAEGTVLNRTGYNGEWTRISIDGSAFYVYSEYVTECEAPVVATTEVATDEDGNPIDEEPKEKTIVIDAGNQSSLNASTEPIGPGSEEEKIGASTGVNGVNGTSEYQLNLTYAQALKTELESRGYTVTMIRENNDDNITNKERAEKANSVNATAYLRIKMNYSTNDALDGVMAQTVTSDSIYNSDIYEESHKFATRVLQGVVEATGATNHGIYETDQMTAMNWSEIPVATIDLGYLSNASDEEKLNSEDYMKEVVSGLADGVDLYYSNVNN